MTQPSDDCTAVVPSTTEKCMRVASIETWLNTEYPPIGAQFTSFCDEYHVKRDASIQAVIKDDQHLWLAFPRMVVEPISETGFVIQDKGIDLEIKLHH